MASANLKKITIDELREIVVRHKLCIEQSPNGKLANLSGFDLRDYSLDYVDLSSADLSKCDLTRTSLFGAKLTNALLTDANLTRTNLRMADLTRANLCGATLTNTEFLGATLREARLIGAVNNGAVFDGACIAGASFDKADDSQIARLDFGGWPVTVLPTTTTIGCQRHSNHLWLSWTAHSPEIKLMNANASEWWEVYGDAVKAVINAVMNAVKRNQATRESNYK